MDSSVLRKLNHVAVLVRDLPAAVERYTRVLGGKLVEEQHLPGSGADVAVIELGGAHIELLSTRQPGSKVATLLSERGEGIHHLSFEVGDIEAAMAELRNVGIALRDQTPRPGLHDRRIAFLEPRDTCGVLIELVEENLNRTSE